MKPFDERRQFERINVDFPIIIRVLGLTNDWVCHVINLSADGIFIWSMRPLPLNVPFEIYFPFKWGRAFTKVQALRCERNSYGCQFLDSPEEIHESLCLVIRQYALDKSPKLMHELWKYI